MKTIHSMLSLMLVALVILAGCSSDTSSAMEEETDIVFPRQSVEQNDNINIAEVIIEGKFVEQTGCLIVDVPVADTYFVPLWPKDYTLRVQADAIEVLKPNGEVAVTVGEDIVINGMESPNLEVFMSESEAAELQEQCPGRYWAVGSGVGPLS